jgi:hypothetical protein
MDLSTLKAELEKKQQRYRRLVGRIGYIEASVGGLGINPQEWHRAVLKPVRACDGQDRTGTVRVSWSVLVASMPETDTLSSFLPNRSRTNRDSISRSSTTTVSPTASLLSKPTCKIVRGEPPSVHPMILNPETNGFTERIPGEGTLHPPSTRTRRSAEIGFSWSVFSARGATAAVESWRRGAFQPCIRSAPHCST